jgi:hypothetical protein
MALKLSLVFGVRILFPEINVQECLPTRVSIPRYRVSIIACLEAGFNVA